MTAGPAHRRAVTSAAPDVSGVTNLSLAPAGDVVSKNLVANLVDCPTLGAPSRETQTNPLLDTTRAWRSRSAALAWPG